MAVTSLEQVNQIRRELAEFDLRRSSCPVDQRRVAKQAEEQARKTRPLAASEAQIATVTKMHKAGKSLRFIAEDTSLGLRIIRTIIGRTNRNDRTTKQRWERIQIDKAEQARWKRQKRTGDMLPRRAQAVVETGHELVKEAKGLGQGTGGKRAGSR